MEIRLKSVVNIIFFSPRTGHLRPLVRHVLFDRNLKGRKHFRWITHKKSGRIKRKFLNIEQPSDNLSIAERQIQILSITRNNREDESLFSDWRQKIACVNAETLIILLREHLISRSLAISFSHDNFKKVSGGIQLCVDKELGHFNENGRDYLHVYPKIPVTRLADKGEDIAVGLSINGIELPPAHMSEVLKLVRLIASEELEITFVIHHLMGHSPEIIGQMIQESGKHPTYFWVHDYFSLCRSYTLLRNGIQYCDAPDTRSNACMTCAYGADRQDHMTRIGKLASAKNMKLVFPSEVARDILTCSAIGFDTSEAIILPHIRLNEVATVTERSEKKPCPKLDSITIAFIGTPVHLKGWDVFRQITELSRGDENLNFLVFSAKPPVPGNYRWIPVHTTADTPHAMVSALENCQVDIVITWPGWAETFSFVTCEAIVGGAYVITNSWSGNVARLIEKHGRGIILESQSALLDFLSSPKLSEAACLIMTDREKSRFVAENSKLTYEIMESH